MLVKEVEFDEIALEFSLPAVVFVYLMAFSSHFYFFIYFIYLLTVYYNFELDDIFFPLFEINVVNGFSIYE